MTLNHNKIQSHIGCICLTFLHCAFSNCSSNRLPERKQSHTGCICLTFRHCAFSDVSSNGLCERMHNHIVCICLTFLHCVSSNVSSNRLHNRMQSHIGCICLILITLYSFFLISCYTQYQPNPVWSSILSPLTNEKTFVARQKLLL